MSKKTLTSIFILFLTTLLTFIYTVNVRKHWFGELSQKEDLTPVTVLFAKNWIREGPLKLKFGMFWNPKSVEFKDFVSRSYYGSFPPGALIPIYILGKLFPDKSLVKITMAYNLLNHFLIAFFLSMTIFFFLLNHLNLDLLSTAIFSLIPIFLELLLPGPLYWHQDTFYADTAVFLPFVFIIFLEVTRECIVNKKVYRIISLIQSFVFFYGTLTEWFMCLVGFVIYLKRFFHGELGKSIRDIFVKSFLFWSPLILGLGFFLIQMIYYNNIGQLIQRFLFRSGLVEDWKLYTLSFEKYCREYWFRNINDWYSKNIVYLLIISLVVIVVSLAMVFFVNKLKIKKSYYLIGIFLLPFIWGSGLLVTPCGWNLYTLSFREYWFGHLQSWYGVSVVYLLFLSLAIFLLGFASLFFIKVEVKIKKILLLMGVLLLPCFLYLYILKEHSIVHDFSVLKFSIPISTVIFILLPLLIFYFSMSKVNISKLHQITPVTATIMLACSFLYLSNEHPRYREAFPERGDYKIEKFISKNTNYKDMVFSPHYEIPSEPPQQLAYSMKRVYNYQSPYEILLRIVPIKEDCIVNILTINDKLANQNGFIKKIRAIADDIVSSEKATLYKINKNKFTKLLT